MPKHQKGDTVFVLASADSFGHIPFVGKVVETQARQISFFDESEIRRGSSFETEIDGEEIAFGRLVRDGERPNAVVVRIESLAFRYKSDNDEYPVGSLMAVPARSVRADGARLFEEHQRKIEEAHASSVQAVQVAQRAMKILSETGGSKNSIIRLGLVEESKPSASLENASSMNTGVTLTLSDLQKLMDHQGGAQ